jgi:hypothetical protein
MRDLKAIAKYYSLRIGSGPGRSEDCHSCQICQRTKRNGDECAALHNFDTLVFLLVGEATQIDLGIPNSAR